MFKSLVWLIAFAFPGQAIDVLTSEFNNNRTGHNPFETILTPANVGGGTFGKLGQYPVDDLVYARPLALDHYRFAKGVKNAVIFATENNSVYAYDAARYGVDALIWHIHFGAPLDVSSVPGGPTHGHQQFLGFTIGCMATPVIDKAAGVLYALCSDGTSGSITAGWQIHRVDLKTGAELGTATQVIAKFPGTGNQASQPKDTQDGSGNFWFNGHYELARIPLALANGILYTFWSAYGDQPPGHGHVIGYRVSDMTQVSSWTVSPSGSPGLGSLWQSGRGVPVDLAGTLYLMTGNGSFNGTSMFGDSWVKLTAALTFGAFYSPSNNAQINAGDWDISSSGPIRVPETKWLVGGAKDRLVRVIDVTNMGGTDSGNGRSPTKVTAINATCNTNCAYQISGIFNQAYSPANKMFFESDVDGPLYGLKFNETTGVLSSPSIQTAQTFGFPGAFISVSCNGLTASTCIVWAATADGQPGNTGSAGFNVANNAFDKFKAGTLRAFRASDLQEIYNSDALGRRDAVGALAKFQPPMPINGKVYLPSFSGYVNAYGLGASPVSLSPSIVGLR